MILGRIGLILAWRSEFLSDMSRVDLRSSKQLSGSIGGGGGGGADGGDGKAGGVGGADGGKGMRVKDSLPSVPYSSVNV